MTIRSGLASSVGFGDETTWGTAVTPTVWVPLVDESISQEIDRLESDAIISGARVLRSQQWEPGAVTAGGDLGFEVNDKSKGLLLKHMFGGTGTTGPFTPADLSGLGLTVQVGVPDVDTGTVRPKTLAGAKVASWEIGLAAEQIATLGLSVVGRFVIGHRTVSDGVTTNGSAAISSATAGFSADDVNKPISGTGIPAGATIASVQSATAATLSANATATGASVAFTIGLALTTPTYAASIMPMSFVGGSVTLAGATFKVREITIAGDNGIQTDRRYAGQSAVDEPLEEGLREYSGTIETEYWSDVAYRRFLEGTETALVCRIARGTRSIEITMNARYDGTTPQVGGRGRVGQTLPFKCVGASADSGAISAAISE